MILRKISKLGAGIALLALVSIQPHATADYTPEALQQLKEDLLAVMEEDNNPGASIALVTADEVIWAGGLGKADLENDIDVAPNSLFRAGSISKSFTALALLKLVEQGRLDLDMEIRDIVPSLEYENPWAETHPITVAHALEHTTGFDDIHFVEIGAAFDPNITLADGLAFHPHSRESRWPPGTHMSYCNSGPPIAALVLEAVTDREFEEYAEEYVFEAIGMSDSTFQYPYETSSPLANGYALDGETQTRYDHIIVRPSGALNTSAMEMSRYLRMMINRGNLDGEQIFLPETIDRMERPMTTLAGKAGHEFGYGLGNYGSIIAGHEFHGHDGGITGFNSTSAYSSDLGVGYFISVNKPTGLRKMAELIVEFLADGREPTKPPVAELTDEELQNVAGYYQVYTPRNQIMNFTLQFFWMHKIYVEDGKLFQRTLLTGATEELLPVSATSFRKEDEPVATYFLVDDEFGNTFLQSGLEGHEIKISGFSAWGQEILFVLCIVLMLSALVFGLVFGIARVFRKLKSVPTSLVLPPFLTVVSLFGGFALMAMNLKDLDDLIYRSTATMSLFLGTTLFGLLSAYLAFRLVRPVPAESGRVVRTWSQAVSIACIITALYLLNEEVLGLRLWSY